MIHSHRLEKELASVGVDAASEARPTSPLDIDDWLATLRSVMTVPQREHESICEELREHLHERVRDLIVAGENEAAAVGRALSELGTAADLARQFQNAHRTAFRRRTMMHLTTIGICAAAVTTGAFMIGAPGADPLVAVYQEQEVRTTPPETVLNQRINLSGSMSLAQVFEQIDALVEESLVVHWDDLEAAELTPDSELALTLTNVRLETVLTMLPELLSELRDTAFRFRPDLIEFGLEREFDFEERTLAAYSVGDILKYSNDFFGLNTEETIDALSDLLHTMVAPNDWDVNGGVLAQLRIVGGKMFVEAPPRMHERIVWILDQFKESLEADMKFGTSDAGGGAKGIGGRSGGGTYTPVEGVGGGGTYTNVGGDAGGTYTSVGGGGGVVGGIYTEQGGTGAGGKSSSVGGKATGGGGGVVGGIYTEHGGTGAGSSSTRAGGKASGVGGGGAVGGTYIEYVGTGKGGKSSTAGGKASGGSGGGSGGGSKPKE